MKKRLLILTGILTATLITNSAQAQYPVIPRDLEAKGDSAMRVVKELSDKKWEKILPIIEKDAQQGKPFIPQAAKPGDLPQASIPAFPGAEGGGAYAFG